MLNPTNEEEEIIVEDLKPEKNNSNSKTMILIIVLISAIVVIIILWTVVHQLRKKKNKIDPLDTLNSTDQGLRTINVHEPEKLPDDYSEGDFEYDAKGKLDFSKPTKKRLKKLRFKEGEGYEDKDYMKTEFG